MDISRLVRPPLLIGGLEFSDRVLRYVFVDKSLRILKRAHLAIPPGIIESGRVADEAKLVKALTALKYRAGLGGKAAYVIGVLAPGQLYAQMLTFPALSHEELGEAVLWNAQMLLPFKPEEIYFDWEERTKSSVQGNIDMAKLSKNSNFKKDDLSPEETEASSKTPEASGVSETVLLLLAERRVVDPYLRSLEATGFLTVALESPSRSIARFMEHFPEVSSGVSMLSRFLDEGMLLAVIADGLPWFDYWRGWDKDERELFARVADVDKITNILHEEFRRLVQFAKTKFPDENFSFLNIRNLDDAASGNIDNLVEQLVASDFKELTAKRIGAAISPPWFIVLGAALRGVVPRSGDRMVSLTPLGTEDTWKRVRIEDFLSLWTRFILTAVSTLFVLSIGVDLLLAQVERSAQSPFTIERRPIQEEVSDLGGKAKLFNAEVLLLSEVLNSKVSWSSVLEAINEVSRDIDIKRLLVERNEKVLKIEAVAPSAQEALRFKDRLAAKKIFSAVELPLSTLTTATPFSFRVIVTVKP